jgi:hypothetical protein
MASEDGQLCETPATQALRAASRESVTTCLHSSIEKPTGSNLSAQDLEGTLKNERSSGLPDDPSADHSAGSDHPSRT